MHHFNYHPTKGHSTEDHLSKAHSSKGFTLIEMMVTVAIVGILAGVAGPSLSKYVRRAKTTEAVINLKRLYEGSVAYYYSSQDNGDRFGNMVPPQFPGVGLPYGAMPGRNECCGYPQGKCPPADSPEATYADATWNKSPWTELRFAVSDYHYYWYEYNASGTGIESIFTARAMGDLNCNKAFSAFERTGAINPETGDVIGGALFAIQPLE